MRIYRTEGIIIRRTNFGEADRLLTIFTKDYGKIKVLAKGIRRITSRRGGNVELLNSTILVLREGRNLDTLEEATVKKSFSLIRKNLKKIAWAYHVCEIVDGLCPERQENREVFDLMTKTLSSLNEEETGLEEVIISFERSVLKDLGFWPRNKDIRKEEVESLLEQILEKKLRSKSFLQRISLH